MFIPVSSSPMSVLETLISGLNAVNLCDPHRNIVHFMPIYDTLTQREKRLFCPSAFNCLTLVISSLVDI